MYRIFIKYLQLIYIGYFPLDIIPHSAGNTKECIIIEGKKQDSRFPIPNQKKVFSLNIE